MKRAPSLGLIFCALVAARAMGAVPQRVMSLNLCSDQLVLDLLPPDRISSVTFLSRRNDESYLVEAADRVRINHGTAEEVVQEKPDLVIAGLYTTSDTRRLIKEVGIPMLELPPANDFQEIRNITRQVAHAVGAEAKGESLIREMDATLAQLAATAPSHPMTIIAYEGSGEVRGKGTLFDAIAAAAGAVNLGALPGLRSGRFSVELLLLAHPDLLAFGDATIAEPALEGERFLHPAIRARYAGRELVYPELLYSCGLPQSAQAARQMRQVMLQVMQSESKQ